MNTKADILKDFKLPDGTKSAKETSLQCDIMHGDTSTYTDVNEYDSLNVEKLNEFDLKRTECSHLHIDTGDEFGSDNFTEQVARTSDVKHSKLTNTGHAHLSGVRERKSDMLKETLLQCDVMHCNTSSCNGVIQHDSISAGNLNAFKSKSTESSHLHIDDIQEFVSEHSFDGQVLKTSDVTDDQLTSPDDAFLSGLIEQKADDMCKHTSLRCDVVHGITSCTDVNASSSANNSKESDPERTESSRLHVDAGEELVSEESFTGQVSTASAITDNELTSAGDAYLSAVMRQKADDMFKCSSLQCDVMYGSKPSCADISKHDSISVESLNVSESERTESSHLHTDSKEAFVLENNFKGTVSKTNDASGGVLSAGDTALSDVTEQQASDMSNDEECDFDIIGDIYSVDTTSIMQEWTNHDNNIDEDARTGDQDPTHCDFDMADAESKVTDETEDVDVISDCDRSTATQLQLTAKCVASKSEINVEAHDSSELGNLDLPALHLPVGNMNAFDYTKTCLATNITETNIASDKEDGIDIELTDDREMVIDMQISPRQESAAISGIGISDGIGFCKDVGAGNESSTIRKTAVGGDSVGGDSARTISEAEADEKTENGSIPEIGNKTEIYREACWETKACNEIVDVTDISVGTEVGGDCLDAGGFYRASDGGDIADTSSQLAESTIGKSLESSSDMLDVDKDAVHPRMDTDHLSVQGAGSTNVPATTASTNEEILQISVLGGGIDKNRRTSLIITDGGSIRLQVGNSSSSKDDAPDIGLHRLMVAPDQSNKMQLYMVPTKDTTGKDNKAFMVLPSHGTGWTIKPNEMGTKSLVPVYTNKDSVAEKDEKGNIKLVYTEGLILSKADQNKSPLKIIRRPGETHGYCFTSQPQSTTLVTGLGGKTTHTVCPSTLPHVRQPNNQTNKVVEIPESNQMSNFNAALARTAAKTGMTLYVPPKTSRFYNGVFVPIKKLNQKNVIGSSVTGTEPKAPSSLMLFPTKCIAQDAPQTTTQAVSILKTNQVVLGTPPRNILKTNIIPGSQAASCTTSGSNTNLKVCAVDVAHKQMINNPTMDITIDSVFSLTTSETKTVKASDTESDFQMKGNKDVCENKDEPDQKKMRECYVVLTKLHTIDTKETFDNHDLAILDTDMDSCSKECRSVFWRRLFNAQETVGSFTEEELDQLHIDTCTAGCHNGTKNVLAPSKVVLRSLLEPEKTAPNLNLHRKRKVGRLSPVKKSSLAKMQRQSGEVMVLNTHAGRVTLSTQPIPSTSNAPKPVLQSLLTGPNALTFGDLAKIRTPLSLSNALVSSELPFNNTTKSILVLNPGPLKIPLGISQQTSVNAVKQVASSSSPSPSSTTTLTSNCVILSSQISNNVIKSGISASTVSMLSNPGHTHLSNNAAVRFAISKPGISIIPRSQPSMTFQSSTAASIPTAVVDPVKKISQSVAHPRMNLRRTNLNDASNMESGKPSQKFYLVRVEDKNILMPIKNDSLQPLAYVLDNTTSGCLKTDASGTITLDRRMLSKIRNTNVATAKGIPLQNQQMSAVTTKQNIKSKHISETNPDVNLNPFSVKIKSEAETNGYGDGKKTPMTIPVKIKAEPMNRGYSDEVVANNSQATSFLSSNKASASVKPEPDKSNSKTKMSQEERIRRLKELLKEQEKTLDEMRQRRTLSVIDI